MHTIEPPRRPSVYESAFKDEGPSDFYRITMWTASAGVIALIAYKYIALWIEFHRALDEFFRILARVH